MRLGLSGSEIELRTPAVMGVLNVTPDSFSDGGVFADAAAAVEHGLRMEEEGAAIVDVGGESTRPGALPVSVDEEIRRVVPVVERLARELHVPISVDTSKPQVMRAALAAGAAMINDVRALSAPGAIEAVLDGGAAVCLMHMQGEPSSMQQAPAYDDVVAEVRDYLAGRAQACLSAGIPRSRIFIDPGIGFGKLPDHNLALLARLEVLAALGYPVLVGISRKSLVGKITGRGPAGRLPGSIAFAALAVARGASIVRAHDVAATVDAVNVAHALLRVRAGGNSR